MLERTLTKRGWVSILTCSTAALLCADVAKAQGSFQFQNLDFEAANLSAIPAGQYGGAVSSLDALPGWTCYLGPLQTAQVLQNNYTLGDANISILGPNWSLGGILDGQYTVLLQPGLGNLGNNTFGLIGASISQTALVPANAQSLQFKANAATPFSISLGGQTLTVSPIGTGANYTLYGANIPGVFAGQSEALTIAALAAVNNNDYFDSFVFSPNSVPEPSSWAVMFLGGAALFWNFKVRRSRLKHSRKVL